MTFDDLVQAARAAEAAGDLDGCAACQLEMYAMVQKDRSLLRRVDPTYLRIDHLIRVIAAALFAMERGDVRLASYYLAHFPQDFLPREGCFPEYRATLGQLAYARGAFAEAAELFEAHLASYPRDEQSWMLLGNAWYRQGRFGQAVRAYGRALQEKARFPAAEENRRRAFAMMMAPDGASLAPISEPSQALGVDPEDWEEVRMLPVFINCRDRVGCLRRLVDWLLAAGYRNLILLDNASTYAPLLQYYETVRSECVRVVRLGENLGHTALWESGVLECLGVQTSYVYTDPDVLPGAACPPRFLQAFARVLAAHPSLRKAGAALRYDDVTYRNAAQTIETEDSYYHAPLGDDVYFASVDTTFALYRNVRFYHRGPAVRMGGMFVFRHLPWYYDYEQLPEDEQYYLDHANSSASLGEKLRQMTPRS